MSAASTIRPTGGRSPSGGRRVLIVEDNSELGRSLSRSLSQAGFTVQHVCSGVEAAELLMRESFDAVLSDICLPEINGVDLLRMIRAYDVDVPVILMTGNPSVETALEAMELGAVKYLKKPLSNSGVMAAVQGAISSPSSIQKAVRLEDHLAERFDAALHEMWIAFQPIADMKDRSVLGYEAFVRSREPGLSTPAELFAAAESLGRVAEVGVRARALAAHAFAALPDKRALLFLNVNATDLEDRSLYSDTGVLAPLAGRIVLEIGDCSAIGTIDELRKRVSVLRLYGYQVALGNLGSGFPGLDGLVEIEPDMAKVAMGIVRNIDESRSRQEVVRSMDRLAERLDIRLIAEGVENERELSTLRRLGCRFVQGYHIGPPSAALCPARTVGGSNPALPASRKSVA
ncbi:MAG: EAL domain-containing protein [Myxococcales bacterium]|nr:EAL domain-containing protein [Myxococcales bacterium]